MNKKVIFTDRSNSLLVSYLRDISKYKILSPEDTIMYIKKAQEGDKIAKDLVVNSNLRFVVTIAKQFQNRGIPLMDLISAGNLGMIKAVDKFDATKGVTFLSYAVWWIRQSIYNNIYWNAREIRLPMSQQLLVISILDNTNKFIREHGRNPSSEELSEMTGIDVKQIDYLAQFSNKLMSVDDYIGGDEDNSQVGDIIPDGEKPIDEEVNKQFVTKELERYLSKLSIRENALIKMLFGIGMPAVNNKIVAKMFGVGTERIRQMKEGALAKLKRRFSNKLSELY